MELTQYIEGVNPIDLKNYLFCRKHNIIVRESKINDSINDYIYTIRDDTNSVIRMETVLNKSFEKITLTDILSVDSDDGVYFKYKNIVSNIFFRYFNIKLIEDILDAVKLSKQQIQLKYGGRDRKCKYLSGKVYNAEDYINRYKKSNDTIILSRSTGSVFSNDTLRASVDFSVLLINTLLDSDDPSNDFIELCKKYNVRYSTKSLRYVKTFMKNKTFYRNYRRHLNNIIKKGFISYKGENWKISRIYTYLPFLYFMWLTIKGGIPGRKWDKKLGVVKTDE